MARKIESNETNNTSAKTNNILAKTSIAPDLLAVMDGGVQKKPGRKAAQAKRSPVLNVIIEFNRDFVGGIGGARLTLLDAFRKARNLADLAGLIDKQLFPALTGAQPVLDESLPTLFNDADSIDIEKSMWTDNYVFAKLTRETIGKLSEWKFLSPTSTSPNKPINLVYKIWHDQTITRCVYESVRTIKCDAARNTFRASGKGIVWAVADTGIDATHPHFKTLKTIEVPGGLMHKDFTESHPSPEKSQAAALTDEAGHGTHVAGIIAGLTCRHHDNEPGVATAVEKIVVKTQVRDSNGNVETVDREHTEPIAGLARDCKLLSLKVLTDSQSGDLSNLLAALGYVQRCNDNGRSLKIHGVNLSLGYPFDPEWFAAGQSPLCVEVDRLVRSGVVVVAAAGNGGYGIVSNYAGQGERASHMGTIADPGNASLAITVGSTHRDMPHAFGVSFFSAKGPTSDGRMKPDLVAPGERIVSCAVMNDSTGTATIALFREDSGTSMAAPHVSGAIAAFLSVRSEFRGRPEEVKDILIGSATNLKRRPEFQGAGLLDLMRALQSV